MKIKEPFLLAFSIFLILGSVLPTKEIRWQGVYQPFRWPMRFAIAVLGLATLVLWYSLPPR